jgi:hypothetical protein
MRDNRRVRKACGKAIRLTPPFAAKWAVFEKILVLANIFDL